MRNVEIKAKVEDMAALHKAAAELSGTTGEILKQQVRRICCPAQ